MSTTSATISVITVQQPLAATLAAVRHALQANGLSAVQQFDLPGGALILVDSPMLLFEAVALERAAAARVPIHVVLSEHGKTTTITWGHPTATTGLPLSAASESAVNLLYERLTHALGVPFRTPRT